MMRTWMRGLLVLAALALAGAGYLTAGAPDTVAADTCPDVPFTPTPAGKYPPGCRVYEKVSPADKGNGEVTGNDGFATGLRVPAKARDTVVYAADGAFGDATRFPQANQYMARRGSTSWSETALIGKLPDYLLPINLITSPNVANMIYRNQNPLPTGISADGRKMVVGTNRDPDTGALGFGRPYIVDTVTGVATPLVSHVYPYPGQEGLIEWVTVDSQNATRGSDDFSTVAFSTTAALEPAALTVSSFSSKLYLFHDGSSRLASYTPSGTPTAGWQIGGDQPNAPNLVSPDGATFFWWGTSSTTELYRSTADDLTAPTAITASENTGGPVSTGKPTFLGASPDGEVAYFYADRPLTDDAPTSGGIFRYRQSADPDHDPDNLTLVSADAAPADGTGAAIDPAQALASDDGSTVYFWAAGALVAGQSSVPAGERALYAWRGGDLRHVTDAVLPTADVQQLLQVSADGRFAAFDTSSSLGGADTAGFRERYRYDYDSGELVCVSCRQGQPSTVDVAPKIRVQLQPMGRYDRTYLADDGTVFFQTDEALLPEDSNGVADVYEYGGRVRLISTGRSTSPSRLGDAQPDGDVVYLITREPLSALDTDTKRDLYAVRRNGGLPEPAVQQGTTCRGGECQSPSGHVAPPSGATETFRGSGNVPTARHATHAGRFRVARRRARHGRTVVLRVTVPGRGTIRVSGRRVRRSSTSVRRAGTRRIRLRLTVRARHALARRHRVRVRATVRFTPSSGAVRRKRVTVTFRQAKAKAARVAAGER